MTGFVIVLGGTFLLCVAGIALSLLLDWIRR